jgi:anti-anti-sigma factor
MEKVLDCVRNGKLPVALDMRDVPVMNSAGLRVLIIAQRDLDRRGQRLSVRSAQPAVDTLLRVAGLDALMEVRP